MPARIAGVLQADIAVRDAQLVTHLGYPFRDVTCQGNGPVSATCATDSDGEVTTTLLRVRRQNQLEETVHPL